MKETKSIKKRERDWTLYFILFLAIIFRVAFLDIKPPHFDEGINGWWVDQLISKGYYPYDPTNYHGPLHFYLLFFFKLLMGRNLWALRLPSVIAGIASIYLLTQLKEYVGKFTAYGAALFMAVSPAMVFYSRYAIHEPELLFFSLLTLIGFLQFQTKKDVSSIWYMGVGIAGMAVTKETFFIHLVSFGIAYSLLLAFETIMGVSKPSPVKPKYKSSDVYLCTLISLLIIYVFYTGFFIHNAGIFDFFRSFAAWARTGETGNGHQKSFWYWALLFMRYEWIVLVGLILSIKLILPSSRWLRLIGIYGVGIFLAYSLIPYKTPWCITQITWPLALVAVSILEDFSRHGRKPFGFAMSFLIIMASISAAQSIKLNFVHYADDQEPYVYVQTFKDVMPLIGKIKTLASADANNFHMPIKIYMDSNWPLPWLLGDFTKVSYFGPTPAGNDDADVVLVDASKQDLAESLFKQNYFYQKFRLRSAQGETVAYFKVEKFRSLFSDDAPIYHPPVQP